MMRAGLADSTWIFLGWEGVSAELQGLSLRTFSLQDAGVPYGYSPVLLAHPVLLANEEDKQRLAAFLEATERGGDSECSDLTTLPYGLNIIQVSNSLQATLRKRRRS